MPIRFLLSITRNNRRKIHGELMKTVIITTADNMSDETFERICGGFREKLGEVSFKRVIDNGIIGGFIADIDGEIYDLSISSQLKEMQKQIKK